jgi:hypothetical protein
MTEALPIIDVGAFLEKRASAAATQEQGSVVGSATTTPIDPTRSSAAGRPTRSMLRRQTRRNWRRNPTQNPP